MKHKQPEKQVTVHFTEIFNGKVTKKQLSASSKVAKEHLQLMKNNPYIKDFKLV